MSTPEIPNAPTSVATPSRSPAATIPASPALSGVAKIRDQHRVRKAIVYIRQSSPQQVAENKESSARQYARADVAVALGWPRDRVEVIDRDQGHSGKTAEGRPGFQYVLAEVGLDHVGLLLGLEASRLARSDPDGAPLVRLCGVFRTLLGDFDGLYDPTDFKDRLLLGLKSSSLYCTGNYTSAADDFPAARPQPRLRAT
jgi:resolvase-like protein